MAITVYGKYAKSTSTSTNMFRAYITYEIIDGANEVSIEFDAGFELLLNSGRKYTCVFNADDQSSITSRTNDFGPYSPTPFFPMVTTTQNPAETQRENKPKVSNVITYAKSATTQTKTLSAKISANQVTDTSTATVIINITQAQPAVIHFDANGGTGTVPADIDTFIGAASVIPSTTLTREGYEFRGWNTAAAGGGTAYQAGQTIRPDAASITLYAQWASVFIPPSITNLVSYRVDASEPSTNMLPEESILGAKGFCRFSLSGGANTTNTSCSLYYPATAATITCSQSGNTYWAYTPLAAEDVPISFEIQMVATGLGGDTKTTTRNITLTVPDNTLDIAANGKHIALFGNAVDNLPAPKLTVGGESIFQDKVSIMGDLDLLNPLPITEGGTGADNLTDARTNLGIEDGLTVKKIWKNASPTSSFAAQTLNTDVIDTSGYEMFIVRIKYQNNVNAFGMGIALAGAATKISMLSNDNSYHVSRTFTFNDNGTVSIATGYRGQTSSYATVAIPAEIWGIKGVNNAI